MTPRLLLLLPSSTYRTDAFIAATRRLAGTVDVVTATDGEVALPDDGPRGSLSVPFDPVGDGLKALTDYASRHPLTAVVGVDDHAQSLAALLGEALGLPYSPAKAVAGTLDKLTQVRTLAAAGLPVPRTLHRAVVKPRAGRASQGVVRLADDVFVQEYIPWSAEVAVEALLTPRGLCALAIFDKPDPLEGPTFEETIYVTPSRLPRSVQDEVVELAGRACAALGLTHGPAHIELRIDPQGAAWVIEVNPRSIGGRCSAALRFDSAEAPTLEDLILRAALGMAIPDSPTLESASAVAMLPVPRAGKLQAIGGLAQAQAVPGVRSVDITVPPGAEVVPLPEGDRYIGFVTAFGADSQRAEASVRAAVAALEIEVN